MRRSLVCFAALLASVASSGPSRFPGHPGDGGPIAVELGTRGLDPRLGEIFPGRPPARVEGAASHARSARQPLRVLHEGSACDVDLDCVVLHTEACGTEPVATNVGFYQLIGERREAVPGDAPHTCEPSTTPAATCREGYCLLPDEEVFERFPERVPFQGGWAYATPLRRNADRWWGGETVVAFPERLAFPPPVPDDLRNEALRFGAATRLWSAAFAKRREAQERLNQIEARLDDPGLSPETLGHRRQEHAQARDVLLELADPGPRPQVQPPPLGAACDVASDCVVLESRPCYGELVAASTLWKRAVGESYDRLVLAEGFDCEPSADPLPEPSCEVGYCTLPGERRTDLPGRHAVEGGFAFDDEALQRPLDAWKAQRDHMRTP